MYSKSKVACISALVLFLVLIFGCTSPVSDKNAFDSLASLEEKYFAVDSLPTSTIKLNDYVTDLSILVGKTSGSSKKVIEAELYSAQTLLYLNKALQTSNEIDFQKMKCSSTEVRSAINSIKLALDSEAKAVAKISSLSVDEGSHLRTGQIETIKGFGDKASQLQNFFDTKC